MLKYYKNPDYKPDTILVYLHFKSYMLKLTNMKLARQCFLFLLLFSFASSFFAPKIFAQQISQSCVTLIATPGQVSSHPTSISVQATINTAVDIRSYNLEIIYGRSGPVNWKQGSAALTASAVSGAAPNWTISGTISSELLSQQGQYNIAIQANGTTFGTNGSDCLDTVLIDTNEVSPSTCDFSLPNRTQCQISSTGTSWTLSSQFSPNCNANFVANPRCNSSSSLEFGPEALASGFACVPCVPNTLTPTKAQGEVCTDTNECLLSPQISCRSVATPNRCLYASQARTNVGASCVVGEDECDSSRLICIGSGATGTMGTCQNRPACDDVRTGPPPAPGNPGSQCGIALNNPYAYCNQSRECVDYRPETQPDRAGETAAFDLCKQTADFPSNGPDYQACIKCITGSSTGNDSIEDNSSSRALWTAFGCIHVEKQSMIKDFLRIGLSISGGFVLLSILYGAFLLTTSSGDPKRVQQGQEMVSSAVMGLFFVIFSIIILQFIGVQILQIPGFGT